MPAKECTLAYDKDRPGGLQFSPMKTPFFSGLGTFLSCLLVVGAATLGNEFVAFMLSSDMMLDGPVENFMIGVCNVVGMIGVMLAVIEAFKVRNGMKAEPGSLWLCFLPALAWFLVSRGLSGKTQSNA